MRIQVSIFSPHNKQHGAEPEKLTFIGNYAIEQLLIKISEKYFGSKVSEKIENLLKTRIGDE
jgi:hypothetical protein